MRQRRTSTSTWSATFYATTRLFPRAVRILDFCAPCIVILWLAQDQNVAAVGGVDRIRNSGIIVRRSVFVHEFLHKNLGNTMNHSPSPLPIMIIKFIPELRYP